MAPPTLSEEEIDDLLYFARAGEDTNLTKTLIALSTRESVSNAEILIAAKDESKATCLHMGTGNGHLGTIKLILDAFESRPEEEKKTYVNAANEFGNTGLHWAAMGGHLEAIKLLLAAGADPVLTNEKDYMPLDLANLHRKLDVVQFFMKDAGDVESTNGDRLENATRSVTLETLEGGNEEKPSKQEQEKIEA